MRDTHTHKERYHNYKIIKLGKSPKRHIHNDDDDDKKYTSKGKALFFRHVF